MPRTAEYGTCKQNPYTAVGILSSAYYWASMAVAVLSLPSVPPDGLLSSPRTPATAPRSKYRPRMVSLHPRGAQSYHRFLFLIFSQRLAEAVAMASHSPTLRTRTADGRADSHLKWSTSLWGYYYEYGRGP